MNIEQPKMTLESLNLLDRAQGLLIHKCCQVDGNYDAVGHTVSEMSRDIIRAMWELYGTVWGYNLNGGVSGDTFEVEMTPGSKIYTFGVGLVLPERSPELLALIKQRLAQPYEGTQVDSGRVELIIDRASELEGRHLFWH